MAIWGSVHRNCSCCHREPKLHLGVSLFLWPTHATYNTWLFYFPLYYRKRAWLVMIAFLVVSLSHYFETILTISKSVNIYHDMKMTILTKVSCGDDVIQRIPMETQSTINSQSKEKEQSSRYHTWAQDLVQYDSDKESLVLAQKKGQRSRKTV